MPRPGLRPIVVLEAAGSAVRGADRTMAEQMWTRQEAGVPVRQSWGIDEIVEQERPALLGWITAMTRDREAAEDVAQEALVRLWMAVEAGRGPDNPAAWLRRVSVNLVVSEVRHAAVARRVEAAEALRPRDAVPSVETAAIARERDESIRRAIAGLAPADREVITLAAHGVPRARIATHLGRSEPAARTLLCRARARLRKNLDADVVGLVA